MITERTIKYVEEALMHVLNARLKLEFVRTEVATISTEAARSIQYASQTVGQSESDIRRILDEIVRQKP